MKKSSKILLSMLAVFSMIFTVNANAEVQDQVTSDQSPIIEEGTKLFEDITKEKFDSIVPNTIDIDITKTDFANAIIESEKSGDYDIFDKKIAEVNEKVQTKIIDLIENAGYMDEAAVQKETIQAMMYDPYSDFSSITISLVINKETKATKTITINYAKESNYSETDATYVKNKVNGIKFATYNGMDAVFTVYNINDKANADKWNEKTYDFTKLLNDNSITIKATMAAGGFGGSTPWGVSTLVHFYKNGVLYETKLVYNLGAYGTTLENGTPVNVATIEKEDAIYKEMQKQLQDKKLTNIIGAYELTAYGTTYDNMQVTFNVDSKYNGKEVVILHKKKDNTYETFTQKVANGKVTIKVDEFSPFMIALSNTKTETVNKAPNNAQTSSMNIGLYSILALSSLIGIAYIVKKEIA